jgi:hypothetical protein
MHAQMHACIGIERQFIHAYTYIRAYTCRHACIHCADSYINARIHRQIIVVYI